MNLENENKTGVNKIPIIFEDKDVLVVNKPAGLVVHSDGKTKENTLADWIINKYPEIKEVGEKLILSDGTKINRPGIVHRLDRDTSGVLIIAKNGLAFEHLKKQFKERTTEKIYNLIVYGKVKNKKGTIDIPIGKSKSDFRKRLAHKQARGTQKEAQTDYSVISHSNEYTYLEAIPKTGRTHQIRVHLKALGHPVVCDKLYAQGRVCPDGLERIALHARKLSIILPNGTKGVFEAELPEDFKKGLAMLGFS